MPLPQSKEDSFCENTFHTTKCQITGPQFTQLMKRPRQIATDCLLIMESAIQILTTCEWIYPEHTEEKIIDAAED